MKDRMVSRGQYTSPEQWLHLSEICESESESDTVVILRVRVRVRVIVMIHLDMQ